MSKSGLDEKTWMPAIKCSLIETFPSGKYQKLNPRKLGTDSSGGGSFVTDFELFFYKEYNFSQNHVLTAALTLDYTVASSVHVKGFNTYGGGHGTDGTIYPGCTFSGLLSFEYSLTQHWALACDMQYLHNNKTRFKGDVGIDDTGDPAIVGNPSQEQISFAPAIEYNFSESFGIIAGAWITAWGRNSTEFRSGVINFEYNY